jgi:hypothetical protein
MSFTNLRKFNLGMGLLHLIQAIAMVVLSNDFMLSMSSDFLKWSEKLERPVSMLDNEIFSFRAGPVVAGFLFISAFFHFLIASPIAYSSYVSQIKNHINKFRWIEYSLSSSLMIIIIAMLSGVFNWATLMAIFFLNAMMNLFGYMMELHNQSTEEVDWTSYVFGVIAGIVPWIIIAVYFFTAISSVSDGVDEVVPTFVYFILGTLFIFFNTFAVNMFLQYKKIGPWKNYKFGEMMYIVLSLVAKSALAWQVFFGTMRPENGQ